jgi:hypothetical protein
MHAGLFTGEEEESVALNTKKASDSSNSMVQSFMPVAPEREDILTPPNGFPVVAGNDNEGAGNQDEA